MILIALLSIWVDIWNVANVKTRTIVSLGSTSLSGYKILQIRATLLARAGRFMWAVVNGRVVSYHLLIDTAVAVWIRIIACFGF